MVSLRVLIPQGTTNYIENPDLRYSTTGWNAQGATITRTLEESRFGVASLKVVTTGSAQREGAYYRVSTLAGVSEAITVSVYVRGSGKVRIRLDNNVLGGAEYVSEPVTLSSKRWIRIEVSGFSTGGNDLRLYVETSETTAMVRTFYVDGAQLERLPYSTSYCDGDQPDCTWSGVFHESTSSRSEYTRKGGKWYQLAGPLREAEDLYITVVGGLGQAPLKNNVQSFALNPGGYYQSQKIDFRLITLTFHAKHIVKENINPVSLNYLHQLRQMLIDLLKPDLTGGDDELTFEYNDGSLNLYFTARYDGGLEGEWDIRNQFVNSFPVRLLSTFPFLSEDNQNVQVLNYKETLPAKFTAGRINGAWNNLNYGVDALSRDMVFDDRGRLYIVGDFTVINNNAAARDPLRSNRGIAYWDGLQWQRLGTGALSGGTPKLWGVTVTPNGYIYVTGEFTSIGGVAANYVAYWNGSAWNAMGTGLNGVGLSIVAAPNGDIYVGGAFDTAGGVACWKIARWNGSTWNRVGQYGGLNNSVEALEIKKDGSLLYAAGIFTDEQGNPGSSLTRVASYNTTTGLFSGMGSGFDATVKDLLITNAGYVYACGNFASSGSTVVNNIAYWNGAVWQALGTGIQKILPPVSVSTAWRITKDSKDDLVVAGEFLTAGNLSAPYFALWNGSTWANLDISFPFSMFAGSAALFAPKTNDLYITWDAPSSTVINVSKITLVNNTGTARTRPNIYITGAGTLRWIENQNTQKRIYCELVIFPNEEVIFNFNQGTVTSNLRGSLLYTIFAGSDLGAFDLVPGINKIICFLNNDVGATMQISYIPLNWSADATQREQ